MKWINAEQQVTVTLYDEEHEEHPKKTMTVEEMLDAYTTEGCPTMYSNPERNGQWKDIEHAPNGLLYVTCSVCGKRQTVEFTSYCGNCGAKMGLEDDKNE